MNVKWWHVGLLIALGLAVLAPRACPWPDGLERVAEDKGFVEAASESAFELVPDYVFPGLENQALATILAGLIGTLILFGAGYGLGALLKGQR